MTDEQPAPKPRSRKMYVLWAAALTLLLALGLFCWLVVVPVWRVHGVLQRISGPDRVRRNNLTYTIDPPAVKRVIVELGGDSSAQNALLTYARMPRWCAGYRVEALQMAAECKPVPYGELRKAFIDGTAKERASLIWVIFDDWPEGVGAELLKSAVEDTDVLVRRGAFRHITNLVLAREGEGGIDRSLRDAAIRAARKEISVPAKGCAEELLEVLKKIKAKQEKK